ncbi:helix-turn-helix domain-containing protein [Nonomuraea deserti]|uniref:Helix-turn-helix domain-containing protein n=1 Tax=Nonomuraea deserti TaxID=1848322 RepID=A0A4R4WAN1_9ACTN|nr:helix-turn-helix domain-containing protein [Nonomuraea deserti]TDD12325.1 helix-turn-helix domain-containing protein [Nonomuraea deserti]
MPSGTHDAAAAGPPAAEPTLGALLRAWRERALLTQQELAVRSGLSVRTVRRLEADELRRPRTASMRLLAEALALDAEELSVLRRLARAAPEPSHPARTVPRQLPADVAFVGRARELAVLDDAGEASTVVISAIDGMAGVGKTALAVHAAHQLASRFPDGDLFVDLHGHTQGMGPADPADTLARFLGALGVPGESVPQQLEERVMLYRSVLAGRKMLIVLDNAADEAQVQPLLPGAAGCLVLITSRRRLVGLDDARTLSVDLLPLADAIALFTATTGEGRVADAPEHALAEVVRRCGLLPLAIRLAAARLKVHPAWSVGDLLERLEERQRRLGELHAGQRSVTAALDLSCRELDHDVRRAYRLLGLHAGTDIAPDAAAALFATEVTRAGRLLDQLLEVHLLQEPVPGRFRFHDLIRAHAAEVVAEEESENGRHAALTRLLDHYSLAASVAMDRLYPYEADIRPRPSLSGASMPVMPDAAAWLEAELSNLLTLAQGAAEHGFSEHVRHLSATLHRCLRTRGRYAEAETLHRRALAAARAAADRTGEMEALIGLAEIRHMQNRYETAIEDASYAMDIARALGHRSGELRALNPLAMICAVHGQYAQAVEHFTQALEIARTLGHPTSELDALIGFGHMHRLMGRHAQAVDSLARALDIARLIDHRTGEVRALLALGHLHLGRDEHGPATGCFTQALELARGTEHRLGVLDSLTALGDLHRLQGRDRQAGDCYQQALDLAIEIGNRNWQFEAIHGRGRLRHDCGHYEQALDDHRRALGLASDLDQPGDQVRAHDGLAHAHAMLGRDDQAHRHWAEALTILTTLGTDHTDERGVDAESIRTHLARLGLRPTSRGPAGGASGSAG